MVIVYIVIVSSVGYEGIFELVVVIYVVVLLLVLDYSEFKGK